MDESICCKVIKNTEMSVLVNGQELPGPEPGRCYKIDTNSGSYEVIVSCSQNTVAVTLQLAERWPRDGGEPVIPGLLIFATHSTDTMSAIVTGSIRLIITDNPSALLPPGSDAEPRCAET